MKLFWRALLHRKQATANELAAACSAVLRVISKSLPQPPRSPPVLHPPGVTDTQSQQTASSHPPPAGRGSAPHPSGRRAQARSDGCARRFAPNRNMTCRQLA